jgi:peptidoglycan/xylan/chitin deacetylase (PgdA/CDA1 family)
MYHRIVEDKDLINSHWTCVGAKQFRNQLELLDRWGFTPITFEDYRLFQSGELSLPRKPVILTFDDGYLDTYTIAYPLLREFGVKAVVFVFADQKVKTNFWDRHLKLPEAPLMNRRQIVEMHEDGFEIGSHSLIHADLTHLSEDQAWEQISRSRILLEILLNAPVSAFSYPYGATNEMLKKMATRAGYKIACSVATGPASFGDDPYEVRRIPILRTTGAGGFALRLLTPFQYYGLTRWKVRNALRSSTRRRKAHSASPQQREQELLEHMGT